MNKQRSRALTAALIAGALITVNMLPLHAQEAPPPIATEVLSGRSTFNEDVDLKIKVNRAGEPTEVVMADDPSRTVVARITVQPGARFPWHTHPGPVIVNVVAGSLVYVDSDGCTETEYPAGTAFVDFGQGHIHTAFNPSVTSVAVVVATFFEAPAAGPLTIPMEGPTDCPA